MPDVPQCTGCQYCDPLAEAERSARDNLLDAEKYPVTNERILPHRRKLYHDLLEHRWRMELAAERMRHAVGCPGCGFCKPPSRPVDPPALPAPEGLWERFVAWLRGGPRSGL